ncbi:uncharacterized protein BP5553_03234 [Venustampulla echinocandica]|uniref:Uncharacterized protein n=1 Tax=Venustampulla echinocandica TaxID=2656787 RepID=A0A370TTR0_9HELO|nr:uncharacterized protein BP5553_03234 [Venustampulla echinocandica]RDL38894.1 hypothetical protein BP5553_03234 [Venustampulla echinocandica]
MATRLLKGRMKAPTRRGTESDSSKKRDGPSRRDRPSQLSNIYRDALSESNVMVPTSQPVLVQRSQSLDHGTNPTNSHMYREQPYQPSYSPRATTYDRSSSYSGVQVAAKVGPATPPPYERSNNALADLTNWQAGPANGQPRQGYEYGTPYNDQGPNLFGPPVGQYIQPNHVYLDNNVEKEFYRHDNGGDSYARPVELGHDYPNDRYDCPSGGNPLRDLQDEKRDWRSTSISADCHAESSATGGIPSPNSSFRPATTKDSMTGINAHRSLSQSVNADIGGYKHDYDQATDLNLRASYQRFNVSPTTLQILHVCLRRRQENLAYEREVDVWQDNPSIQRPIRLNFRTLLFDTQCRESNWVSIKIVQELRAEVRNLPTSATFLGFNGQVMAATQEASLSFKNSQGGSTYTAKFLVSADEAVPFDMVLGADDCRKFNIISAPTFLALVPLKRTKAEKAALPKLIAEQEAIAKEHERRRKQQENIRAARSRGLYRDAQSSKGSGYL